MTADRRPARYEVAPGCWIVSSAGTSRSGDSIRDTVRAIVEEADRRYEAHKARLRGAR